MRWVETRHPLAGLPVLLAVCTETQIQPSYALYGRLREACRLLKDTPMSAKQIATLL